MTVAYATKALKELHESQLVAGKVAGTDTYSLSDVLSENPVTD